MTTNTNKIQAPTDPMSFGELITIAEAAEYARLTPDTLLNYVRRGRMQARKMGPIWVTTRAAVDTYLTSRSFDNIPKKYRNRS